MSKNIFFTEVVDPFEIEKRDFILKAEHVGRYLFAKDVIEEKKHKVIYDIGSGSGYGSLILSEKKVLVYGFDRIAQKNSKKVEFHKLDFNHTSLEDYCHNYLLPNPNLIVCFETLEHIKDPAKLLTELYAILPKGGELILSVPNAQFEPKKKGEPKNKFHLHLFYPDDIHRLLRSAGFKLKEKKGQPFTNIIIHHARWLLPLFDTLFLGSKKRLSVGSKLFAYPTSLLTNNSYSIIIDAEK